MNGQERQILKEAAEIIAKELEEGREVRIPRFGKFSLHTRRTYPGIHPMTEDWPDNIRDYERIVRFVKFVAWKGLKDGVRTENSPCRGGPNQSIWCCHPDGHGHEGPHINWRGITFEEEQRRREEYARRVAHHAGENDEVLDF